MSAAPTGSFSLARALVEVRKAKAAKIPDAYVVASVIAALRGGDPGDYRDAAVAALTSADGPR